jgi:hypothetical protein
MMSTSVTDTHTGTPRALIPLATVEDVELSGTSAPRTDASWILDVEHVHVNDDPRQWSPKLKVSLFVTLPSGTATLLIHLPTTLCVLGMYRRVYCA